MRTVRRVALSTLLCCAAAAVGSQATLHAGRQEPAAGTASSLTRIKQRLTTPGAPPLAPKAPVRLRPTFKTRIIERPWVPTLEEELRKTFALTDFQRQYAAYAARCCGLDLGALFRAADKALDERQARKVRAQVARELAELEAARAAQVR